MNYSHAVRGTGDTLRLSREGHTARFTTPPPNANKSYPQPALNTTLIVIGENLSENGVYRFSNSATSTAASGNASGAAWLPADNTVLVP